jgi:hypothetical protein
MSHLYASSPFGGFDSWFVLYLVGVLIDASIWSKMLLSPRFLKTENIIRLLLSHAFVLVFQMETIESQNECFTELETSTTPNKSPNSYIKM